MVTRMSSIGCDLVTSCPMKRSSPVSLILMRALDGAVLELRMVTFFDPLLISSFLTLAKLRSVVFLWPRPLMSLSRMIAMSSFTSRRRLEVTSGLTSDRLRLLAALLKNCPLESFRNGSLNFISSTMRATRCLGHWHLLVQDGFGLQVLMELLQGSSVSHQLGAVLRPVEGLVAVDEGVGGVEGVVHVHADDLLEIGGELVV